MTRFVCRWHERKHNKYYFGSHWGSQDDGYVCGSPWMKRATTNDLKTLLRAILAVVTTSRTDLLLLSREQTWLNTIHRSQIGKAVYNINLCPVGGTDGNCFSILGRVERALRRAGFRTRRSSSLGTKRYPETTQNLLRCAWPGSTLSRPTTNSVSRVHGS